MNPVWIAWLFAGLSSGYACNVPPAAVPRAAPVFDAALVASRAVGVRPDGNAHKQCSGVLIGGPWVLTAAHCSRMSERGFFEIEGPLGERLGRATLSALHEQFDVALLRTSAALTTAAALLGTKPQVGDEVWLVGFGMRPGRMPGTCSTLRGKVSKVRATGFVLKPRVGAPGACVGDSGAPLWAAREQEFVLLGLLIGGAESCRGPDAAVAVSALHDWLVDALTSARAATP